MKFRIVYHEDDYEPYLYFANRFCSEKAANKALLAHFNWIIDPRINLINKNLIKIERDYEV